METATVRVSVAPVLAARGITSEQVTQALLGAAVEVLEDSARWARVRMADGYEGWVRRRDLGRCFAAADQCVTLTDLWVNLRTRPDYRVPPRVTAFIGTCLPLQERRPGWLGVALPDSDVAWLEEHRGQAHSPGDFRLPPHPGAVVTTARRFLGVPYLWGGCSPLGLDCSGFVQLVYRLHGVGLPRDARQQAREGAPVPITAGASDGVPALAPGDAVFFHAEGRPEKINHVGLALGDGRFIHALGSDRVRIDPWTETACTQRFSGARRYLSGPCLSDPHSPRARQPLTQAVVP